MFVVGESSLEEKFEIYIDLCNGKKALEERLRIKKINPQKDLKPKKKVFLSDLLSRLGIKDDEEAYNEIEANISELLNGTIDEERGEIVQINDINRLNRGNNRDMNRFLQAFSMECVEKKVKGKSKYYLLMNKENFGNHNFKLIYRNKAEIFQFIEFNEIKVENEYNVSDDYMGKKFSKWEKDKKNRDGGTSKSFQDMSENMENYNCLVIGTLTSGWSYRGWIEQFALEKITITWSDRDDLDKYYLLDENEIIRVGQLLDTESVYESDDDAQNLNIYRQHRYQAKSWNNDNLMEQDEEIFPTLHLLGGHQKFKNIYSNINIGIVNKKYSIDEETEERIPLESLFAYLRKKKKKWVWGEPELVNRVIKGQIQGTFLESHSYFLETAKYRDLDIIYKKGVFSKEELFTTKMIKRVMRTVYHILTRNIRISKAYGETWMVFCDEKWIKEKNTMAIMYSIIPPGAASDCPPTSAFYHGMEGSLYERETISLQKSISENENIENYSFLIDLKDLGASSDPNKLVARGISITFPIIVQIINNKRRLLSCYSEEYSETLKVSFVNERIDQEEYGIGKNIVLETSDRLEVVMEQFEKVEPFTSLPKSPNSHPFLQYPDLIGRKYDQGYNVCIDKYKNSIKEFEGTIDTFEEIRRIILTDLITPIEFFKQLMDSKNIELAKFCCPSDRSVPKHYSEILKTKIHDNINILYYNKDLKTLFKEIRERSEKENSREVITQILTELFVLLKEKKQMADDCLLPKYELSSRDEFEWLMQRLSFETHQDNFEMIEKVRDELNKRKNEGVLKGIYRQRLITMENLFISSDQNSFVFDNFEKSKILEIIDGENTLEVEDNQLGAMCLSLLLKNKNSNSEEFSLAEMGEDYLLKREGATSRRVTNMIEINIIRNLIENDSEDGLIGLRTLQEIKNNNDKYSSYYSTSPYFMAAVLKTIALTNFSQLEDNQVLRKFAKMILDGRCFFGDNINYPNNRVAYWFIRAYFNLNGTSINKIDNRVNKCSRRLFDYKKSDFNYNTVGLMTMCQLLDLYYRFEFNEEMSLFEFEQTDEDSLWEDYREKLNSEKTASSTKKWFEENQPTKDDRLRPLNFNYR